MPIAIPAWSVYLVRCAGGSLYTGIATDVARRLDERRAGGARGARYLRGRGPLTLEIARVVGTRAQALRLEARIKRLSRRDKELLIGDPTRIDTLAAALAGPAPVT